MMGSESRNGHVGISPIQKRAGNRCESSLEGWRAGEQA